MDVTEAMPLDVLRALSDPTRLRILAFVLECHQTREEGKPSIGNSISGHLGLSQPTVSHHMKVLVEAGLMKAHKKGTTVYYSLDATGFESVRDFVTPFLALAHCDPPPH